MRILFLTRTLPQRSLGDAEARLNDRLCELSELGHDVLILTRWTGDSVDFDLPSRIEIRHPFKTFRAWEWPKALPMVFSWRPDVLHVFDPGLSPIDRALSVELMAMTMLETLKLTSRGRSTYRGGLVSLGGVSRATGTRSDRVSGQAWRKAGAQFVEDEWLRARDGRFAAKPWDQALDRPLRLVLAGRVGTEISVDFVVDALDRMRDLEDFELSVFLERSRLTAAEKKRLSRAERAVSLRTPSRGAVGARLKLISLSAQLEAEAENHDAALILGCKPSEARWWLERLPLPVVLSENSKALAEEIRSRGLGSHVLGAPVSEIAPIAQALALATDRKRLLEAWTGIETGSLNGSRDVAANHVSRLYSQIARSASPS